MKRATQSPETINRQILRLAGPNILSNLAVPLLSAVDTALVGHLAGLHFLGAIALGGAIFNFMYWGLGFLRMGTTGLTAQAFGNKNAAESALTFARALVLSLLLAALLLLLQIPLADLSFYFFESSPEVEYFARRYFHIRLIAAPATLALFAFNGWFLGMQNAKYPLYLAIIINVVNIGCSVFFVQVMALNSDGVALGTVCAQYLGLFVAIYLFRRSYREYLGYFNFKAIFNTEKLRHFLDVNRDIFIRTLCLVFAFTYFTAESAKMGDAILAANSILMQLWTIMAYGIDGFAFAAESLVGKYIGKKDARNLRKVIRLSFYWSLVTGGIFSLIYGLFPGAILSFFTDKTDLISLALVYIGWTIAAPLINGFCFIWDGIFIGATDGKALRNSMMFCTFAIFLPVYFIFREALENHALWLAMTVFMAFRGISLTWYARKRISGWIKST